MLMDALTVVGIILVYSFLVSSCCRSRLFIAFGILYGIGTAACSVWLYLKSEADDEDKQHTQWMKVIIRCQIGLAGVSTLFLLYIFLRVTLIERGVRRAALNLDDTSAGNFSTSIADKQLP